MSAQRSNDHALVRRITAPPIGNARPDDEMDISLGPVSPARTPHKQEFPALAMIGRMVFSPLAMIATAIPVVRSFVDRKKWFGGR